MAVGAAPTASLDSALTPTRAARACDSPPSVSFFREVLVDHLIMNLHSSVVRCNELPKFNLNVPRAADPAMSCTSIATYGSKPNDLVFIFIADAILASSVSLSWPQLINIRAASTGRVATVLS